MLFIIVIQYVMAVQPASGLEVVSSQDMNDCPKMHSRNRHMTSDTIHIIHNMNSVRLYI